MSQPMSGRLLLAVRPQDRALVLAALGDEFDYVIAYTMTDAYAAMQGGVAMVLCGVHFDDGRMFDLLRLAKGDPATADIPFIPVLGEAPVNSAAMADSIRSAAAALGADGFIDLPAMSSRLGMGPAIDKLRHLARNALSKTPPPRA